MCFSASASFGAGIVLSVLGVAAIKKATHRSQLFFASIPLLFAVQQLSEGVLWVSLPIPEYTRIHYSATIVFLFFAQIVWPVWVPVSILLLEKRSGRKSQQRTLVGIGVLVSLYLTYCLIAFEVKAQLNGFHVEYILKYPSLFTGISIALYAMATILPSFLSHIKHMWILGLGVFAAYIITAVFYQHYILSVWCFFSSLISGTIYFILRQLSLQESIKTGNAMHG